MACRVEWSPAALQDVEAIATYISRDSVAYAAAVVKRILDSTRNLTKFPFMGRIVPEFDEPANSRSVVYSYRVIYRIEGTSITIASVVHGRRLLDSLSDS